MKKSETIPKIIPPTVPTNSSQPPAKLHVGRELVDTTWRITVPVLLFAVAGLFADKALGSKPWLTLLGVMVGFLLAAQLIKRQILSGPQPIDHKPPNSSYDNDKYNDDEDDEN